MTTWPATRYDMKSLVREFGPATRRG